MTLPAFDRREREATEQNTDRVREAVALSWSGGKDSALALESLREGNASPIELAQSWLGDEHAELRLCFAAELALDAAARNQGLHGAGPAGLTPPADFPKLSAWFDGVNRLREQLGAPLRHDLVLAGLLLDWRRLYDAGGARASGRRTG